MKLMFKKWFMWVLLLSLPVLASAQSRYHLYDDNAIYSASAKEMALLYRGMMAPEYRFQYNGHCYFETRDFLPGQVLYNGRLYDGVDLNIDACCQILVVKCNLILATNTEFVDYAFIGGKKYVNLHYKDRVPSAPSGFLRADYEGEYSFYTQVRKTLSSDSEYHNGEDIGYFDPDYRVTIMSAGRDITVTSYFAHSAKFYMVYDGVATQVRTRAAFLKFFDKQTAKAMKKYASSAHLVSEGITLADYARELLTYRENVLQAGKEVVR